jgi:hypothetical protein
VVQDDIVAGARRDDLETVLIRLVDLGIPDPRQVVLGQVLDRDGLACVVWRAHAGILQLRESRVNPALSARKRIASIGDHSPAERIPAHTAHRPGIVTGPGTPAPHS